MWVYFEVPERRYLEYFAGLREGKEEPRAELLLADGEKVEYEFRPAER